MAKDKGGAPRKITADKVRELEKAFSWGCTDIEACCYADVRMRTFYDYCEKNPEFSQRKEVLKNNLSLQAKQVVFNSIFTDKDVLSANKVIDRKEGTKVKAELTGKDGGAIETKATFNFIPVGADD